MAAPFFSTPFQPYVYQSAQAAVTPFQIIGGEAQVVQIMLKSQEKITAKPGTVCYMSGSIQMDNIYLPEHEGGVLQWLLGKNVNSIVLSNAGPDDGYVGISAPSPAKILPIDLANFGGEILFQSYGKGTEHEALERSCSPLLTTWIDHDIWLRYLPDAFLCSINDVTVTNSVDPRARNIVLSGAEVFLKQKLVGQGLAFLVGGGCVVQKILEVGEVVVVDVACILAMTSTIDFQLKHPNPVRRAMFGGENQLTASLTGPGVVFIQSLPFHRLSQRIARAVTPPGIRENPKFFIQIAIFFFLAYVMILSSLLLTDIQ